LMEHFERLSVAFRDYRAILQQEQKLGSQASETEKQQLAGERQAAEMKCIVYAGILSHYAGDSCMPLHTTVDYDGRVKEKGADGKKAQQGIHAKIDAFPERNGFAPEEIARSVEPKEIDDVWKRIASTIKESYTHIDRCYELDKAGA